MRTIYMVTHADNSATGKKKLSFLTPWRSRIGTRTHTYVYKWRWKNQKIPIKSPLYINTCTERRCKEKGARNNDNGVTPRGVHTRRRRRECARQTLRTLRARFLSRYDTTIDNPRRTIRDVWPFANVLRSRVSRDDRLVRGDNVTIKFVENTKFTRSVYYTL